MSDREWLTYAQVAARLGVTPDAIRHRARKEGWPRQQGNDGKIRVQASAESLSEIPTRNPAELNRNSDSESDREIRRLEEHLQTLHEQIERERADRTAERESSRNETERAYREVQEARQEARDARGRVDALTERLGSLERVYGAVEAERDRLRAELEQARRPWWRRLVGR